MKTNEHFYHISLIFFLEREMFQTKVVYKIKPHIMCSVIFFKNHTFYEIMWKDFVKRGRPQMTIWSLRIACWIPKATNKHSQVVQYSLLFHRNNGSMNVPRCYIIPTLAVLLICGYAYNSVTSGTDFQEIGQ
jgi:hypothetical protein